MPHIHDQPGQVDFTASAYVVCGDRVLLRLHDKYHVWISVGGHIELDEDPIQALTREIKEEVGLDVEVYNARPNGPADQPHHKELIAPQFLNRHPITDTHDHIDLVYFATSKTRDVTPENADDQWRWLTRAEVLRNELGMDPAVQHYALAALDALGTGR